MRCWGASYLCAEPGSKTTKWVGRLFLWIMNSSHSGVTDWGLKHVRIERDFKILDVGCGGGRTIEKLAAHT